VLVEHYAGAFPLWLSPVQVIVLTISEKQDEAAGKLNEALKKAGIRSETDLRSEKIGYKIRQAELQKIPYIAVIGDKEVESGMVALRARGRKDLGQLSVSDLIKKLEEEIKNKVNA